MSRLFSPLDFGPLRLSNRIVIAPMCQYSAEEGRATDWHAFHWPNLAQSGAGLAIVEATANYDDPDVLARVSRGLGEAMVGINVDDLPEPHRLAERGW